ncbi:hypothetical protein, partial [Acidiphilium sp.]|uniref:hypothetical protein n=1 Tax=Acidiphilium sp. TaxID=527 RepID=UPI003D037A2B
MPFNTMTDDTVRATVARWLRYPLWQAGPCKACDGQADAYGDHALTCSALAAYRAFRHTAVMHAISAEAPKTELDWRTEVPLDNMADLSRRPGVNSKGLRADATFRRPPPRHARGVVARLMPHAEPLCVVDATVLAFTKVPDGPGAVPARGSLAEQGEREKVDLYTRNYTIKKQQVCAAGAEITGHLGLGSCK